MLHVSSALLILAILLKSTLPMLANAATNYFAWASLKRYNPRNRNTSETKKNYGNLLPQNGGEPNSLKSCMINYCTTFHL